MEAIYDDQIGCTLGFYSYGKASPIDNFVLLKRAGYPVQYLSLLVSSSKVMEEGERLQWA